MKLQYPVILIDRTIKNVLTANLRPEPKPSETHRPSPRPQEPPLPANVTRLILPYKSAELARNLKSEVRNLNDRLSVKIQPVFTSTKVYDLIRCSKPAPTDSIVSQSKVVYQYSCSWEMSYIGFTNRHLHQRIAEHRRPTSAIHQHCSVTGHEFN